MISGPFAKKCAFLGALAVGLTSGPAHATLYPVWNSPNVEVIPLDDPYVDFKLRSELIGQAVSVDLASFTFNPDSAVGLRMIIALREAANRGAPVRALYDAGASRFDAPGDMRGRTEKLLADSELRAPISVLSNRMLSRVGTPISFTDYFHDKFLILNRGTPREMIILGGRNYVKSSLYNDDSAFLLRPRDPTQPWVGNDMKAHFDKIWGVAASFQKTSKHRPLTPSLREFLAQPLDDLLQSDARKEAFRTTKAVIAASASNPIVNSNLQFRPNAAQFATNNLIEQLLTGDHGKSVASRGQTVTSDIVARTAELIRSARSAIIYSYLVNFPVALRDAVVDSVIGGAHLEIRTNGREAHARNFPMGLPMDLTIRNMFDLVLRTEGQQSKGSLSFRALDAGAAQEIATKAGAKAAGKLTVPFSHKKGFVIDGEILGTGSDNLTKAGVKNDEWYLYLWDKDLVSRTQAGMEVENQMYPELSRSAVARMANANRESIICICCNTLFSNGIQALY